MTMGSITKESLESPIQSSQLEEAKEFIALLKTLNSDEKKELRGMIRGMQAMKEIMAGSAQKMVV